jgi:hypothetical protein
MNALEMMGIRALPEIWVSDATCTCTFNGTVIAVNPEHPAMVYTVAEGWKPLLEGYFISANAGGT